jgi:hypothetical protein
MFYTAPLSIMPPISALFTCNLSDSLSASIHISSVASVVFFAAVPISSLNFCKLSHSSSVKSRTEQPPASSSVLHNNPRRFPIYQPPLFSAAPVLPHPNHSFHLSIVGGGIWLMCISFHRAIMSAFFILSLGMLYHANKVVRFCTDTAL